MLSVVCGLAVENYILGMPILGHGFGMHFNFLLSLGYVFCPAAIVSSPAFYDVDRVLADIRTSHNIRVYLPSSIFPSTIDGLIRSIDYFFRLTCGEEMRQHFNIKCG